MPAPKATGTQGSSLPAPASARTEACRRSRKELQAAPDGSSTAPCAAPRGGQVPATPCVRRRGPPRSAMRPTPKTTSGSGYRKLFGAEKGTKPECRQEILLFLFELRGLPRQSLSSQSFVVSLEGFLRFFVFSYCFPLIGSQ